MQCKGFLSNLGGTLIDSLPAIEHARCNRADRFGLNHTEVLGSIHGKQAIISLRHFTVGKSEAKIAAELTRLEQIEATETTGITALPGTVDLPNHLNKTGIPWVIVTPGSMPAARARHRVAGFPVPEVFATAEQVKRGKLESGAYPLGAQLLDLAPQERAVVEDAPVGALSGLVVGYHITAVNAPVDTPRLDKVDPSLASLEHISVIEQPNGNVVVIRNI